MVAIIVSACGDQEQGADDSLPAALSYFPEDAGAVLALPTDLEGEQLTALEVQLQEGVLSDAPAPDSGDPLNTDQPQPTTIEESLREAAQFGGGISYDDDIEPLLGNRIAIGGTDPAALTASGSDEILLALDTGNGSQAEEVVSSLPFLTPAGEIEGAPAYTSESGEAVAIDGDVLAVATTEDELRAALERERSGEGLGADVFAGVDSDALVLAYGDVSGLAETGKAKALAEVPWVAALRSFAVSVSVAEEALVADGELRTNPAGLTEDELPLAAAVETPELVRRVNEIAGASANQSQTTSFLLDAVRAAYPESRFADDVETVERKLGIDFERDVLDQFDGPSASSVTLNGRFAARSAVSDPEGLADVMRQLAPDIGRLVQDLQGLQDEGLVALFLIAPDAPIAPGVLDSSGLRVERLAPDLYRIRGLARTAEGPAALPGGFEGAAAEVPIPDEIVFGLIDDVFVVASDEERAREIATAEAAPPPEGVEGASVTAADLGPYRGQLEGFLGFDPGPLGELTAAAEATPSQLSGHARIALP